MKIKIAIFFTFLFVGLISAPTIITLVDKNQDISIYLNLSEEEEENSWKNTVKELKVNVNSNSSVSFTKIQKKRIVQFTSKCYVSPYPKIITQPPEFAL
ncbi:hypothetical protein BXQ17_10145 [Polaribacter sp. BM10]|uniref:hypothetical protein n=1 Tax=Polaribacter sp. BM10 TaxID=1529069 RepID=UPI00098AF98A|nr:hypothetical protein [Polaribacter sp. BM10]AQS94401.1 hypothetical protein BXQ17_10145 [Polaribacter sp. BM10]